MTYLKLINKITDINLSNSDNKQLDFNNLIYNLSKLVKDDSYNFKFSNNNLNFNNLNLNTVITDYDNINLLQSSLVEYTKKLDFKNNTLNTINNKTIKLDNLKNVLSTLRRDKKNLIKSKDKIATIIKSNTDKKYIITLLKDTKLKSLYRYCRINNILPIKHSTDLIKNYSKITYNNLVSLPINTIYSGEYSGYTTNKVKCITKLPRDKSNLTVKKMKELNGSIVTFDTTQNSFINTSVLRYSTYKAIANHANLPSNVVLMAGLSSKELLNKQIDKIIKGNKLNYDFISKFSYNELSNKYTEVSNEIKIITNLGNIINKTNKVDCNSILNNLLQGLA